MQAKRASSSIRAMWQTLEVSPRGFDVRRYRLVSARARLEQQLRVSIQVSRDASAKDLCLRSFCYDMSVAGA